MRHVRTKAFLFVLFILTANVQAQSPARAMLDKYCVTCHNERLKTAGLMLDRADVDHAGSGAQTWEKVLRKLKTREMPPPGSPRPDAATYTAVSDQLEKALDAAAAANPNPGRVAVHRLNRTEYTNAVRDLVGLRVDGKSLLSADEADQEGFDNVASVLSVSPALLEGYLSAARTISRLAVGDPTINSGCRRVHVSRRPWFRMTGRARIFRSDRRAALRSVITSRSTANTRSKCSLKRQLYLYLIGMGEPHQIDIRLDGALRQAVRGRRRRQRHDDARELRRQYARRSGVGSSTCTRRTRASRCACR